jgi:hypothetical protein
MIPFHDHLIGVLAPSLSVYVHACQRSNVSFVQDLSLITIRSLVINSVMGGESRRAWKHAPLLLLFSPIFLLNLLQPLLPPSKVLISNLLQCSSIYQASFKPLSLSLSHLQFSISILSSFLFCTHTSHLFLPASSPRLSHFDRDGIGALDQRL